MRVLRAFVTAVLIGAIVAAGLLAVGGLFELIASVSRTVAYVFLGLALLLLGGNPFVLYHRVPGIGTRDFVMRIAGEDGPQPDAHDEKDDQTETAPPRQLPYGLQVANVVIGLAIGFAGVVIAVINII
jgi:hypothetical protein